MFSSIRSGQYDKPPRRHLLRSLVRRILPVFHFGWMLSCSLLLSAVIFFAMHAIDWLFSKLISSTGKLAVTSSNFFYFLRSWQGYAILILFLLSLGIVGAVIMNGVIFLSDDMIHARRTRPFKILKRSISSMRLFLCKEAVPVVLYYYVFVLFFSISLLSVAPNPFEIPGYIRYLLSRRMPALILYFAVFILICVPLVRNPLILHDILLSRKNPKDARFRTRMFVSSHRKFLSREIMVSILFFCAALLAALGIFLYFPFLVQKACSFAHMPVRRILALTSSYTGLFLLVLTVLLSIWILPVKISLLYRFMTEGSRTLPSQPERRPFFRFFLPVSALVLTAAVAFSFYHFDYLYPPAKNIEAVVHRLGGDLDTENTMEGMEKALELGAVAFETDIQRTKDGAYVIFHDSTLKRLCGENRKITDMTLEEVQAVSLPGPGWEERRIPLLSEVLDRAKLAHARLYLELKGTSADDRMARDVAKMVRARNMEQDCVLISLNYDLIQYIFRRIRDIRCGYLYFFAYGASMSLSGDILLAQSNAISQQRMKAIHAKGKQMYCWTINSRRTAMNMVRQRVDGIISDRYDIVDSVLRHMEARTDYERIMDVLLR